MIRSTPRHGRLVVVIPVAILIAAGLVLIMLPHLLPPPIHDRDPIAQAGQARWLWTQWRQLSQIDDDEPPIDERVAGQDLLTASAIRWEWLAHQRQIEPRHFVSPMHRLAFLDQSEARSSLEAVLAQPDPFWSNGFVLILPDPDAAEPATIRLLCRVVTAAGQVQYLDGNGKPQSLPIEDFERHPLLAAYASLLIR